MSKDFLTSSLLDDVPNDVQVICLGENHSNILHRLYLYLNIPELAKNEYSIAIEAGEHLAPAMQEMLTKLGYRPYYLKDDETPHYTNSRIPYTACQVRFPEFSENNNDVIDNTTLTSDHKSALQNNNIHRAIELESTSQFNSFSCFHSAASNMKIMRAINLFNMNYCPVDSSAVKRTNRRTKLGLENRNIVIADNIAEQLKKHKKVLYWGGSSHLFGTDNYFYTPKNSLQKMLQDRDIKTHSIALVHDNDELLSFNDYISGFISDVDPFIINQNKWIEQIEEYRQKNSETSINLHNYSSHAGKNIPDTLISFPDSAFKWIHKNAKPEKVWSKPIYEAQAWNQAWMRIWTQCPFHT